MQDGLRWGGRFISGYIVGVHTFSLLASSRVAHDRATEDNYIHQTTTTTLINTLTVGTTRSTIEGGRGYNKFVPVLGGDGTKRSPTGDIFVQYKYNNLNREVLNPSPCEQHTDTDVNSHAYETVMESYSITVNSAL